MLLTRSALGVSSSRRFHRLFPRAAATAAATAAAAVPNTTNTTTNNTSTSTTSTTSSPPPTPIHQQECADSASAALVRQHAPYMVATYARPPPVFEKGQGSYLWDADKRKYLDFTAGIAVNALGHCDAGFGALLAAQAKTLVHCSNLFHNPWTGALSQLLVEKTLASGAMHEAAAAFICNSGSEANEAAIKFARKVGKTLDPSGAKHEIVAFAGAFHGRTLGSLSATPNPKYQAPFAPLVPGFRVGALNDVDALDALVTPQTCGVMVEPIQGEGGVRVATDDFLVALARRCRAVGAVLHYDEIQCGLARTGTLWAHARLPREAHPDVLTTAKALGNGFPIGATLVSHAVAAAIRVGDHGTTFGGNPLACRVAHYVVTRLADPTLQDAVVAKGAVLARALAQLRARWPRLITELRGRGLILGLQLNEDPGAIVNAARDRGLLIITAGTNTLRFVPSLIISEDEIMEGCGILAEAIQATRP